MFHFYANVFWLCGRDGDYVEVDSVADEALEDVDVWLPVVPVFGLFAAAEVVVERGAFCASGFL